MHEHLSRELFRAIHKGWRNPGDLAPIAMAHLFELCPHCRSEFEAWRGELGEGVARDEGDYDGALQKIRERTAANDLGPEAEEERVERQRREAPSRAEELLALPDDQRIDWIRNEKDRYSGLLLAEALIEECRRKTPGYPREGYLLADLARVVLHHAPITGYAVELYALAMARLANAIRVIGDLPRAEQVLGDARYFLRSQTGGERLIRRELDSLEGTLRMVQYRLDAANRVLLRALMVSRLERDSRFTAIVLTQLARNHLRLREFERSLTLLAEAERILSREGSSDPFLSRFIKGLRGAVFIEMSAIEQAVQEIESSLKVGYQDPIVDLRAAWSRAKIDLQLGNLEASEERYLLLLDEFSFRELEHDSTNLRFELAGLYLRQGRRGEAIELLDRVELAFTKLGLKPRVAQVRAMRRVRAL